MSAPGRCDNCRGPIVILSVPEEIRGHLTSDPSTVQLCEKCLRVTPMADAAPTDEWDPHTVTEALPDDPEAALGVALLVTLLTSLALNRTEIESLVAYLEEEHGLDALLAIERLKTTPILEPVADLDRRLYQLAQVLGREV